MNLVGEKGDSKTQFVFEKGVKVESEVAAENSRRWAPAIQRGTIQTADAARLKREKNGDVEKLTWTFADGKIKRTSFLDEKGFYTDDDSEFFASGKPARKTRFSKSKASRSECWWETGTCERPGMVTARKTYEAGKIVKEEKFNSDGSIQD
ncbi:hypothetical protein BH10BDE1_BH10BDE1_31000 [soil metagenome]